MWYKKRRKNPPTRRGGTDRVLTRQLTIGGAIFGAVLVFGFLIWHGTRIDALTITSVAVEGGQTLSHDRIREIAESKLDGAYFKVVPRRFSWTYPKDEIKNAIKEEERIRDVSISRDGRTVKIAFTEYEPAMLWCATMTARPCYFLDAAGYAFTEAPLITGTSFLRYVDATRTPKAKESPFDRTKADAIFSYTRTLGERYKYEVHSVEQIGPTELGIHLASGGVLKVSEDMSESETIANLETILSSREFGHLRESGNFAYIDLRYGNKVFVLEEEAEVPVEMENTAPETGAVE